MAYKDIAPREQPQIKVRIILTHQKGESEEILLSQGTAIQGNSGNAQDQPKLSREEGGGLGDSHYVGGFGQGSVLVAETALYFDALDNPLNVKDLAAHLKRISEQGS
jgi:hypothetical protein